MAQNLPTVSIVIVTHNSLPALDDCLHSLASTQNISGRELIVVDNGSTDGSPDHVSRQLPSAKLIRNETNLGFAAACNLGVQSATGDFILFLNPDVELDDGAIDQLTSAAVSHEKVGLVSGRLRWSDGSFQATCRKFPSPHNMIFARGSAFFRLLGARLKSSDRYTLPDYPETTEVPAVAATMVMINRELFNQVGGFDPRFFMYLEDTDLSLRLYQSGYRNLFVPLAEGVHGWGKGSNVGRFQRHCHHHWSFWKYFLKHFPNGFSIVVLPPLLLMNLLVLLLWPGRESRPG